MSLLGSDRRSNGTAIAAQIKELKTTFGAKTELGKRRTSFARGAGARRGGDRRGAGGSASRSPWCVSDKGWIRTLHGSRRRSVGGDASRPTTG